MLCAGLPLCMSLSRLGMTKATVGSAGNRAGSVGKSAKRRFDDVATVVPLGTLAKLIQGTCLRAYLAFVPSGAYSAVEPMAGKSSAYPLNDRPLAIRAAPRFGALNG